MSQQIFKYFESVSYIGGVDGGVWCIEVMEFSGLGLMSVSKFVSDYRKDVIVVQEKRDIKVGNQYRVICKEEIE